MLITPLDTYNTCFVLSPSSALKYIEMGKNKSNKRKSQNQEVQTPKKQKIKEENDETVPNIKKTPQKQNNTPNSQKKNLQKENLQKFSGTSKLEAATDSSEESDYEVEQEVKPEKITKTMNADNQDSDAVDESEEGDDDDDVDDEDDGDDGDDDDDDDDDDIKEEIDNAVNENSENDDKKHIKKNAKPNKNKSNVDKTEEIKAFIENESEKGKMRYVLFLGNLPYEIKVEDIKSHFKNGIEIRNVRLPVGKGPDKKPRGFGYLEVSDKESYLKALSMHHTFLKGRRVNVQYTTGGKKNSAKTKSIIKSKNFKLNALRKDGKLEGSKKHSQKRSVRRAKMRSFEKKTE